MAGKPFDVSKFRKDITKSIDGLSIGFNDPTDWISTGNFALNYLISGDFNRGIPLGKVTVFAGESGAGKSYICSGNIVKNAQDQVGEKHVMSFLKSLETTEHEFAAKEKTDSKSTNDLPQGTTSPVGSNKNKLQGARGK